ncbi:MAG: SufD family Fe-S cluster assembly protein, partial [bacterium]
MMAEKNKIQNKLESSFVSYFEERKGELFESCHPAVLKNRKEAFEYFKKLGLPTNKDEKWRNSRIIGELDNNFKLFYNPTPYQKKISEIFDCEIHGYQAHVVSLLNGRYYSPDVDALQVLDSGVVIGSMLTAQRELPDIFSKYYGHYVDLTDNGFTALNSALFRDGVFIYVPDNAKVEQAIQLLKIVNSEENLFVNSRNLIILGKNSEVSFLHCDDSINHNPTFINTLTEIHVGENARLDLYKMQNLNDGTSLLNNTCIYQEKNSRSKVNVITLNGGKIRNELHVNLDGEAAEADLNGIYLMDKSQHVDNQVYMRHSVPHCFSNQLFK